MSMIEKMMMIMMMKIQKEMILMTMMRKVVTTQILSLQLLNATINLMLSKIRVQETDQKVQKRSMIKI